MVSAPYQKHADNSSGSLYVFNGGEMGLHMYPTQVIHASDITSDETHPLKGFGYSSAGGKDLDKNTYPDTVVGAYLSDNAVFIRYSFFSLFLFRVCNLYL